MKIIGIYKYEATTDEFDSALADQWGEDIPADKLEACRSNTREHFDGLYLIEMESEEDLDDEFDWSLITQDNEADQVPYDEQMLNGDPRRWTFFFHFLDLSKPLRTPMGDIPLPTPTPRPGYLSHVQYYLP